MSGLDFTIVPVSYCPCEPLTEKLLSCYKVNFRIFIPVGLFCIHLLSHDDIYSLYPDRFWQLLDCVRYNEDFITSRFVTSRFCSIHFTVTLAGLKNIICYTKDFVI